MIKMSKGMIPAIFNSYLLENSGYNKVFGVFGNSVQPTRAELQAVLDANEAAEETFTISPNQVANIDPSAALRTEITYPASFVAKQLATNFFRFETSLSEVEFTNRSLGDATWFLYAITNASVVGEDAETPLMFVGDVGDPESDAEIKIVDEQVGSSVNYLLNDLEISYRV